MSHMEAHKGPHRNSCLSLYKGHSVGFQVTLGRVDVLMAAPVGVGCLYCSCAVPCGVRTTPLRAMQETPGMTR